MGWDKKEERVKRWDMVELESEISRLAARVTYRFLFRRANLVTICHENIE